MSYRPYTKTSNGIQDWAIDAETVKGHAVETTGISSNTNTLATTAQVKAYVDANFTTEDWTFTVENNGTTSTVTKRIYMKTITS